MSSYIVNKHLLTVTLFPGLEGVTVTEDVLHITHQSRKSTACDFSSYFQPALVPSVTTIRHHREMREKKCELANSEFSFLLLHGCQMAIAKFLYRRRLALWAWRTMAPLGWATKFDPFLSLDCVPDLHPGTTQGKEGIKSCHLATLYLLLQQNLFPRSDVRVRQKKFGHVTITWRRRQGRRSRHFLRERERIQKAVFSLIR